MDVGVKDTTAFRVMRQITDHTWGSDVDLSDDDVVYVCRSFSSFGGTWEALLGGDMRSIEALEKAIDSLVAPRKMEEASQEAR